MLFLLYTSTPATASHRLLGAFTRPGVGFGALPANRQPSPMSQTSIAANFYQPLDVHLALTA
jgi:hypothetical protein